MNYLKKYQEILIQIGAFIILGFVYHRYYLLIYSALLLLVLCSPTASKTYTSLLKTFVRYLGNLLKGILFSAIFILIIIPISLFRHKKKPDITYIPGKRINKSDFEKIW